MKKEVGACLGLGLLNLLGELGNGFEEVCGGRKSAKRREKCNEVGKERRKGRTGDETDVGDLEDGGIRILKVGRVEKGQRRWPQDSSEEQRVSLDDQSPAERNRRRRRRTLLIATIVFESFIPAKCWIAPEIPTAT